MISSYNYEYAHMKRYWDKLNDLYRGEEVVKSKGQAYLPASSGMILDGAGRAGTLGEKLYQSYLMRAEYRNHIKTGVERYVGLCHQSSPTIQLPPEMEYLREKATKDGQSLESLLRMINTEQVKLGRCGLFVDVNTSVTGESKPYIAFYDAFSIINWNESDDPHGDSRLVMLIMHEVEHVCTKDFSWTDEDRYRVCLIDSDANVYMQGVFIGDTFDPEQMFVPRYLGSTLDEIPFVFVNSCDCLPKPDYPPLDDLANTSLSAYRRSADYMQALHMQGQDTLVIKGNLINVSETENPSAHNNAKNAIDQGIRTGAGAVLNVSQDGDAKFIGVSGDGIPEMRTALENTYVSCEMKSGNLLTNGSTFESGESLKTRLTAQTATLNQIALTGAFALQKALRIIAKWIGADESKVVVQPNLEFSDFRSTGDDLVKIITAKKLGYPASYQSIYEYGQSRGYFKEPFDTQIEMIKKEEKSGITELLTPVMEQGMEASNSGLNPLNGNNAGKSQQQLANRVANKVSTGEKEISDVEKVQS